VRRHERTNEYLIGLISDQYWLTCNVILERGDSLVVVRTETVTPVTGKLCVGLTNLGASVVRAAHARCLVACLTVVEHTILVTVLDSPGLRAVLLAQTGLSHCLVLVVNVALALVDEHAASCCFGLLRTAYMTVPALSTLTDELVWRANSFLHTGQAPPRGDLNNDSLCRKPNNLTHDKVTVSLNDGCNLITQG
jgi:hypothetical protein